MEQQQNLQAHRLPSCDLSSKQRCRPTQQLQQQQQQQQQQQLQMHQALGLGCSQPEGGLFALLLCLQEE